MKYQICVSGASGGESSKAGKEMATRLGEAIAKHSQSLITGATGGLPHSAAVGYKKAGGKSSLGLSPASSKAEHIIKYALPTKPYDNIVFSALNYPGRDALLISSSDAVAFVGGRIGTLHEFAVATELDKPMGFLQGAGGISDEILSIMHAADHYKTQDIIFTDDPDKLIISLISQLDKKYAKYKNLYR